METHRIHPELLERQVRVLVVNCKRISGVVLAGLFACLNPSSGGR